MDKATNEAQGQAWLSITAFFRLLLCTKRRWYFLLSLMIVLAIKYIYQPSMPMPVREYFTTYRIKYSDPGIGDRASKSFGEEEVFRPQWAMNNPYDRDMAIKYFESTKIIIDAGSKLNYTVRYWHEGKDIYEHKPIDLRFLSDSISDTDRWNLKVRILSDGIELSDIKGVYKNKPIKSASKIFISYDNVTESPMGRILVRQIGSIKEYQNIKVTKMSELDAQDKYDGKMRRYMGSNLIELFLTADCTRAFARDFFHQIAQEYESYAKAYYIQELDTYLRRLDNARSQISYGYKYLNEYGIAPKQGDETIRQNLSLRIDRMLEEAQTNALLLSEKDMIEIIDDTLIRFPKQIEIRLVYINLGLALLFVLLPILMLLLELILKRPVLIPNILPKPWNMTGKQLLLPKNMSSSVEWNRLEIQLKQILLSKESSKCNFSDCTQDKAYPIGELYATMPIELQKMLTIQPPINMDMSAAKMLVERGVPLVLRLRSGFTPELQVKELNDWCAACGVELIILWDHRV